MMEEIWKPVVGYEGLYEVSSHGRVRSLDRYVFQRCNNSYCYACYRGRVLKRSMHKDKYFYVTMYKNGIPITIAVHRVVAMAFVPNPCNEPIVNHKDENKINNTPDNLEWCNVMYNNNYGTGQLRSSIKRSSRVEQLTMEGAHVAFYYGTREAGRVTGISHIRHVCNGTRKSAGGYVWRYV